MIAWVVFLVTVAIMAGLLVYAGRSAGSAEAQSEAERELREAVLDMFKKSEDMRNEIRNMDDDDIDDALK